MTKERAFEIECELLEECGKYIDIGSEPKDDLMEACVNAFMAVQVYRREIEKVRRAATQADKKNIVSIL